MYLKLPFHSQSSCRRLPKSWDYKQVLLPHSNICVARAQFSSRAYDEHTKAPGCQVSQEKQKSNRWHHTWFI